MDSERVFMNLLLTVPFSFRVCSPPPRSEFFDSYVSVYEQIG